MKEFQSFLKKHKKKLIILAVVLVIFIVLFVSLKKLFSYFNPNSKQSEYGDRCELTEGLTITEERKNKVKEAIEAYEGMTLSTIDIKCNLIDIIVNADASIENSTAKEMSDKLIAAFDSEELKYYDLELWVNWTGEGSEEKTPMIGTKHKTLTGDSQDHFVWSLSS